MSVLSLALEHCHAFVFIAVYEFASVAPEHQRGKTYCRGADSQKLSCQRCYVTRGCLPCAGMHSDCKGPRVKGSTPSDWLKHDDSHSAARQSSW